MKELTNTIFSKGNLIEGPNFSGDAFLYMLSENEQPVANVTFAPGCRNNWHTHQGGQILLVTNGRGYYQEWGKDARELHAGDVVDISANVKHWHGAACDNWFVHLALELHPEKGPATWLEPVSENDYQQLK